MTVIMFAGQTEAQQHVEQHGSRLMVQSLRGCGRCLCLRAVESYPAAATARYRRRRSDEVPPECDMPIGAPFGDPMLSWPGSRIRSYVGTLSSRRRWESAREPNVDALAAVTSGVGGRVESASYNQNLWIDHPFEGAAYLPR